MKRLWSTLLILTMVIGLMSGCGANTAQTTEPGAETEAVKAEKPAAKYEEVTVKVGYMPNYGALWAIENAIAEGYLEEEAMSIEFFEYQNGAEIVAALNDGTIDVGYIGQGAHSFLLEGEIVVITLSQISNAEAVITGSEIGTPEELKGKKVAYTAGSASESILLNTLKLAGLTMDDIEAVEMEGEEIEAAMIAGELDACASWEPFSTRILEGLEGSKKLTDNITFINETASLSSWITTEGYVAEGREVVVRFVRAMYKAMDYAALEHVKETAALVAKRANQPAMDMFMMYNHAMWMTGKEMVQIAQDGSMKLYYENQRTALLEMNPVENARTVDEYLLLDIMTEAGQY